VGDLCAIRVHFIVGGRDAVVVKNRVQGIFSQHDNAATAFVNVLQFSRKLSFPQYLRCSHGVILQMVEKPYKHCIPAILILMIVEM
jgi:hypothetical protein